MIVKTAVCMDGPDEGKTLQVAWREDQPPLKEMLTVTQLTDQTGLANTIFSLYELDHDGAFSLYELDHDGAYKNTIPAYCISEVPTDEHNQ